MRVVSFYFFEGECEGNFVKAFKASKSIRSGKAKKVNLWNTSNINQTLRLLPAGRKVDIFIIFDTDVISEIDRFVSNIAALAKNARKVILLPQHHTYEDELAFTCGITNTLSLPQHLYNITSFSVLKARLAQEKNLVEKLNASGFNIERMWSRIVFQDSVTLPQKNISWGVEHILENVGD